jgi:Protein of unknown function (DUF1761)
MLDLITPVLALGALHFLIGGFWYSPAGFAAVWMRGLGIMRQDIDEARINVAAGLLVSAAASLAQVVVLVWVLQRAESVTALEGAFIGIAVAFAFSFLPMLKDRVWAARAWSVILVDAGYEMFAAALIGGLAGWWFA